MNESFEYLLQKEIEKLDQLDSRIDETAIELILINKQIKQMEQDKWRIIRSYYLDSLLEFTF